MDFWHVLENFGSTCCVALKKEFTSPFDLLALFDTDAEARDLLRDIFGESMSVADRYREAEILIKWNQSLARQREAELRRIRDLAKKPRLELPVRASSVEIYDDFLNRSVELKRSFHKSLARQLRAHPLSSKQELEVLQHNKWADILVGHMVESNLPVCEVAAKTSNSAEVLRRSLGNRRMKTLRARARAWSKVRD